MEAVGHPEPKVDAVKCARETGFYADIEMRGMLVAKYFTALWLMPESSESMHQKLAHCQGLRQYYLQDIPVWFILQPVNQHQCQVR